MLQEHLVERLKVLRVAVTTGEGTSGASVTAPALVATSLPTWHAVCSCIAHEQEGRPLHATVRTRAVSTESNAKTRLRDVGDARCPGRLQARLARHWPRTPTEELFTRPDVVDAAMTDVLRPSQVVRKAPTGIAGLDEITHGGLPAGRPTLVCGGPGSRQDAARHQLPGQRHRPVRRAGRADELRGERRGTRPRTSPRSASTWPRWSRRSAWPSTTSTSTAAEIEETGEYDLEGLFVRLDHAVSSVKPSAWCSTPSSRCSPACRTRPCCARSCAGCSAGCATAT